MTSDQMQPDPSWLVGDFITGSSVDEIAKRYGVDVETAIVHIDYGMMVRKQKLAGASAWTPSKAEPKKTRKATTVPVTPTIAFREHQIRVIADMYCLGDLMDMCGMRRQNIQNLIKHIDLGERQKHPTREEGAKAAKAWFATIEGIKQWTGRWRSQTRQRKPRQMLRAFIEQQTREYTPWMPLDRLARLLGQDEYDLLWWLDEPKGDAMGLECNKNTGRCAHLYRAHKPTEPK